MLVQAQEQILILLATAVAKTTEVQYLSSLLFPSDWLATSVLMLLYYQQFISNMQAKLRRWISFRAKPILEVSFLALSI
jgi:hypothetical protein